MNCEHCEKTLSTEVELEIHRLKYHIPASTKCLLCNKYMKSITHHLKRVHSSEYEEAKKNNSVTELYYNNDNLKCKYCSYKGCIQHLITHIKNIHIAEVIECEICRKRIKKMYCMIIFEIYIVIIYINGIVIIAI